MCDFLYFLVVFGSFQVIAFLNEAFWTQEREPMEGSLSLTRWEHPKGVSGLVPHNFLLGGGSPPQRMGGEPSPK